MNCNDNIFNDLVNMGLCDHKSLTPYFSRVRDRDDVSVFRCQKSDIFLLSSSDHLRLNHYENKDDFSYWGSSDREAALKATLEDNQRRVKQFDALCHQQCRADIGTGAGGIPNLMRHKAKEIHAFKPQSTA